MTTSSKAILPLAAALAALFLLTAIWHPARAAAQDGMVAVRDPQTGKLRAPTPDELRALRASTPPNAALQAGRPGPGAAITRHDGSRGLRLGEQGLVYDIVTRDADGHLTTRCVHGEAAAQGALAQPAAHAEPEEHAHEAR